MRLTIVDGGWGGHRLAFVRLLNDLAVERKYSTSILLSDQAASSVEARVHLSGVNIERVPCARDGETWWRSAIAYGINNADVLVLAKCDNVLRHESCIHMLSDAPLRARGTLLKVAPRQGEFLYRSASDDRAQRLRCATRAIASGALDRLALMCGFGDTRRKLASLQGGRTRWIEDVPYIAYEPAGKLLHSDGKQYALVVGEISWRKRVNELLGIWAAVYSATSVHLALVGPIHESVAANVSQLARARTEWLNVKDSYVDQATMRTYYESAIALLGTFDSSQYVASGAVAIAQELGVPVISYGNGYVDWLVSYTSTGIVLPRLTAPAMTSAIKGARSLDGFRPLRGAAVGARRELGEFLIGYAS